MCGLFSNDPLISMLRSFGYNVVRLPREDISPLQVLTEKNKEFHLLGELETIFKAGPNIEAPKIKRDIATAEVSGQKCGDLKFGIGLSFLGGILSAMGGSSLGLDAAYSQVQTVSFQYEDVLQDRIDLASLDQYLTDADINPLSTYVKDLLEADDVYVINSIIKSKKFSVLPKKSKGATFKPDIPSIQNIVGAKIQVSSSGQNASTVTFEGADPLVFGFQATRLFYHGGRYTSQEPAKSNIALKGRRRKGTISDSAFINIMR